MADVADAIRARLLAHSPLTALVASRIYPEAAPDGAQIPFIRYRVVSTVDTDVFGGTIQPSRSLMQFGTVAKTYDEAQDVGAQIAKALERWSGTALSVVVQAAFLDDEWDPEWDDDFEAYAKEQDFIIWHEE